jgi:hypothetical protein
MRRLTLVFTVLALVAPVGASAASWTDSTRPKASWTDSTPTASWTDTRRPKASWTDGRTQHRALRTLRATH